MLIQDLFGICGLAYRVSPHIYFIQLTVKDKHFPYILLLEEKKLKFP